MREMKNAYNTLVGNPEGKRLDIDVNIILEWILRVMGGGVAVGCMNLARNRV
jgi:hypothetical protein